MTDTTTTDRWTPGPWAATDYLGGGAVGPDPDCTKCGGASYHGIHMCPPIESLTMPESIPATYNGSWSIDFDRQEIRADEDGSVLFDVHNGMDEESLIAAAAPQMFNALVTLLRSRASGWDYIDPALEAMWGTIEEAVATAAGQTEAAGA